MTQMLYTKPTTLFRVGGGRELSKNWVTCTLRNNCQNSFVTDCSFDNQLATSLLTSGNRLVVNERSKYNLPSSTSQFAFALSTSLPSHIPNVDYRFAHCMLSDEVPIPLYCHLCPRITAKTNSRNCSIIKHP